MKKLIMDLHTHTMASGHAFSTLKENIDAAIANGMLILGTSDHAIAMPGTCTDMFFENYKVVPRQVGNLQIYRGIEANILDFQGKIDVSDAVMNKIDYCIASLHPPCITPGSIEENTKALLYVMQNENVKIIGHPDDSRFPIYYDEVVMEAVATNTILELNNSSLNPLSTRQNGYENNKKLLEACMRHGAKILAGTDSHICYDVGRFEGVINLLKELDFPEELVLNTNPENMKWILNNR